MSKIEQQFVDVISELTLFPEDKRVLFKLQQVWGELDNLIEEYGFDFDKSKYEGIEPEVLIYKQQFEKWANSSDYFWRCSEEGPYYDIFAAKGAIESFVSDLQNLANTISSRAFAIVDIVEDQLNSPEPARPGRRIDPEREQVVNKIKKFCDDGLIGMPIQHKWAWLVDKFKFPYSGKESRRGESLKTYLKQKHLDLYKRLQ